MASTDTAVLARQVACKRNPWLHHLPEQSASNHLPVARLMPALDLLHVPSSRGNMNDWPSACVALPPTFAISSVSSWLRRWINLCLTLLCAAYDCNTVAEVARGKVAASIQPVLDLDAFRRRRPKGEGAGGQKIPVTCPRHRRWRNSAPPFLSSFHIVDLCCTFLFRQCSDKLARGVVGYLCLAIYDKRDLQRVYLEKQGCPPSPIFFFSLAASIRR